MTGHADGPDGPARNRVLPTGEIVAVTGRGAWMGNRGRLHEGRGTRDVVRTSRLDAWITCRLSYKDWRAEQWEPTSYTPLFFADEAAALAAGHRPCAMCRRADFTAFRDAAGASSAPELDARLKAERGHPWTAPWADLPDGAFVLLDGGPAVVAGDVVTRFDVAAFGYADPRPRPSSGTATVVTPATTLAALRAGYVPQVGT